MTALYFAVAFLMIAVIVLGTGFFILARQIGVLYERIAPMGALVNDSGPKVGDQSPTFSLPSLTGDAVQLGQGQHRSTLVFFLSPTCPVCKKLIPILRSVRDSEEAWLDVVLASDGEADKHQRFIEYTGLTDFPYLLSPELGIAYRVSRLPFAVLLDDQGTIRSKGLVNSREQLESLFNAHEMNVPSIQGYLDEAHS
jgi:methylamine dehydrogenase accessory protein MauD